MTETDRIRVLSVDDHPLLREGLAATIDSEAYMVMVGQAANGTEGVQKYRDLPPDVTLRDLRLPDLSGRYPTMPPITRYAVTGSGRSVRFKS
jgi:DNA-binding NarL/FixJ family response regulator